MFRAAQFSGEGPLGMEAWNQLLKDPANYFLSFGVAAILGVWWARMTPAQSNLTLVLGVLAIGVAVFIKTGGLPFLVRGLWVGAALCLGGLFVNYQLWTYRAETIDAKRVILASVENADYRELVVQVIHAFQPHAYISVAGAVLGPDGARTVDIQVWPTSGGVPGPTVIDVIDRPDGQPVGIDAIDSADSKRRDVRAQAMLLCSNTGFDALAIQKAKRSNIGLIAVLKHGDKRIRGRILEEIYLRRVNAAPVTMEYEGAGPGDLETLRKYMTTTHNVTYKGGSVDGWLQQRALMIISSNPGEEQPLIARFELKKPTEFLVQGHQVTLQSLSVRFHPRVKCLSQIVTLDAKNGIYDYVRGRVRLAGGSNSYVLEGVNFDTAKPMDSPPPISGTGVGLHPGEVDITLLMIDGVDLSPGTQIPKLEELVKPEDLSLAIPGSQPAP